jgi:hypothetical protein
MVSDYGRAGGGPPPAGNGSEPVNQCGACGAMWTGDPASHLCRRGVPAADPAPHAREIAPAAGDEMKAHRAAA